jgi:pSer/pThr/pTyr-binding forkhead associated (FHA) protein
MAYLIVRSKGKAAHRLPLTGPITLGRALKCDLWVDDPALSREHCRFEKEGNKWFVVDLRSRNGTYIGTQPVDRYPLADGEMVRIGATQVEFHDGVPRPTDPEADQINRLLGSTEKDLPAEPGSVPPPALPRPKPVPKSAVPSVAAPEVTLESIDNDAQLNVRHPLPTPRPMPVVRPVAPPAKKDQNTGQ